MNSIKKINIIYFLLGILLFVSITMVHAIFIDKKDISASFKVANTVTITFDTQGGSSVEKTAKFPGKTVGSLPTTTKVGYQFVEWNTKTDGTGDKATRDMIVNEDKTFYAIWKSSNPKITLHFNDEKTASTIIETTTASALPTPSKTGYTFDGWYVAEKITSISIDSFSNPNADYPWTQDSNGIWSSGNNGIKSSTSNMISEEFTLTENGTLSFDWKSYGESNFDYLAYDVYNVDTGSYLSGQTNPTYKSSLGNLKGKASTTFTTETLSLSPGNYQLLFMYGKDSSLDKNDDKGYVKNVMFTSGEKYVPSETYRPDNFTDDIILCAKWSAKEYSYNIVYKSSSGKQLGTETVTKKYGSVITLDPKDYTGYTSPSSQTINWDSTSKTITFVYTPIQYDITIDCNGGSGVSSTKYTIESSNITLGTPSKNGYTFTGWTGSNGTSPSKNVTIAKGSTGNKSYTANWSATNYSITYNLNGGTQGSGAVTSYTIESSTITLPTPSRTGYTFVGWYTNSSLTGIAVTSISKGSTGNKTFYAKWNINTYTVTFVDGTGKTVGTRTVTHGGSVTDIPLIKIHSGLEKKAFLGYDGSYTNVTSDRTLTAQWSSDVIEFYIKNKDYSSSHICQTLSSTHLLYAKRGWTWNDYAYAEKFIRGDDYLYISGNYVYYQCDQKGYDANGDWVECNVNERILNVSKADVIKAADYYTE